MKCGVKDFTIVNSCYGVMSAMWNHLHIEILNIQHIDRRQLQFWMHFALGQDLLQFFCWSSKFRFVLLCFCFINKTILVLFNSMKVLYNLGIRDRFKYFWIPVPTCISRVDDISYCFNAVILLLVLYYMDLEVWCLFEQKLMQKDKNYRDYYITHTCI